MFLSHYQLGAVLINIGISRKINPFGMQFVKINPRMVSKQIVDRDIVLGENVIRSQKSRHKC